FQAEDGIRDFHVTGVQTCALPISTPQAWDSRGSGGMIMMSAREGGRTPSDAVARLAFISFQNGQVSSYTYREPNGFRTVNHPDRSEERRVGNECRTRGLQSN